MASLPDRLNLSPECKALAGRFQRMLPALPQCGDKPGGGCGVFLCSRDAASSGWLRIAVIFMSFSGGMMVQKLLQKEMLIAGCRINLLDIVAVQYKIRIAAMQQQD